MVTAIASLATNRRERPRVAMTGEITLTGRVLPVGGIKEKVLAARRAGILEIILPERNRRDVEEDVPAQVRESLKFHFVSAIEEVLNLALEPAEEQPEPDLATARRWSPNLDATGPSRNREPEG
jgi:ATP-dependent Lon protease